MDDLDPDDHFGVKTFDVPVANIATAIAPNQYDKTGLRVIDGTNYIVFTIRFTYQTRRAK